MHSFNFDHLIKLVSTWITHSGIKIILSVLFLFIGWKVINKVLKKTNSILTKKNIDPTLTTFFHGFADIALKILLVILIISYLGIETTSLAAIIASAGLAVGLALQGSLSNFAGGVIILLIRPFNVGDTIEVANSRTGIVEQISIFYTHIITGDNKEIMVPNGSLVNGTIINYSTKELRRVDLTFGVGYGDDIIKVKRILSEIINENNLILKTPEPFIALSEQAASSVNFVVRAWVKNEDYWTVHFYLLEESKLRFDKENISIPFPQMDVHVDRINSDGTEDADSAKTIRPKEILDYKKEEAL
ncbi:mechanosensitive ion channel domain-containing protein [uncultured Clostridium sp.]|uniref:mechanosensitive ion channel family protein n=1 Tax=uncultured Clostridium sp. TaxID=59620 RepID=UPI002624D062|nr:mechanosensitive ion channel domain-containing protein [uncultured Clostridium sp.]